MSKGGPDPFIGGGGGGKLKMPVATAEDLKNIIGYELYIEINPKGLLHFILSDIKPSVDKGKYLIKLNRVEGIGSFWVEVDEDWVVKRSKIMEEIFNF